MSSRSRALALFAVPLAFSFALTSCQDGNDPAATTSPSESPAAASPTASPSPTKSQPAKPVPASAEGPAKNIPVPEMPEEAESIDEHGATAFLVFYFELMNHALETYDSTPLEKVTYKSCRACYEGFIFPLEANAELGHWQVGGKYNVAITASNLNKHGEATLRFNYGVSAQTMYEAPNKPLESIPAAPQRNEGVAVLKEDSGWKLLDFNFAPTNE